MNNPILTSTLILTLLLAIGLLFFIRASTKDRIQVVQLVSEQPERSLLEQLQQYFTQRAYRIVRVDAVQNQVIYEGLVRPSVFLAIFLTTLAGIGTLCLSLVLSMVLPDWKNLLPTLALLSPLAGIFYWKKSERREQVALRVETRSDRATQSIVTVTAHRDELAELQQTLSLKPLE